MRRSVRSGSAPESETTRIGNSEKLISLIENCSAPAGNWAWARVTRSRTSARVSVRSQPNSNSSTTPAMPSPAVEEKVLSPSRPRSSLSSGRTSSRSLSSAEMPGKGTETKRAGISMSGSPSFGRVT
jgi:hypothetical protein